MASVDESADWSASPSQLSAAQHSAGTKLRVLDLFSGIGSYALGLQRAGFDLAGLSELNPYCQAVLRERFNMEPHGDVRTLEATAADVLVAGWPCQNISPVSVARTGLDGEHSGLWSEVARLVRATRPRFVLLENSTSLLVRGMGRVLSDLAASGYDAEWDVLPAAAFGANHLRARLWILAYPTELGDRLAEETVFAGRELPEHDPWWSAEPDVCRVDAGSPGRVDRLSALGNTNPPQVTEYIGKRIAEAA